jgi:hypothetical protein
MNDDTYTRKLDELDRLINDPNVPMQPDLIWRLLDEIIVGPRQVVSGRFNSVSACQDAR